MTKQVQAGPVAAVDLGSNSFHMVIARVVDGHLHVVDRMRERVQLASGSGRGRHRCARGRGARARLPASASASASPACPPTASVQSAPTRSARPSNRRTFLRRCEGVLGHDIDVIPGREEARILFRGVTHDLPVHRGPAARWSTSAAAAPSASSAWAKKRSAWTACRWAASPTPSASSRTARSRASASSARA